MKHVLLLSLLLMIALPATLRAQADPSQFRFEHLTVNEGLSHSDAMAVVQDRDGFIWVGTNKGVNRYDGYELKPYLLPIDNDNGLSNNRVRTLHVSPQGTLWAGTEGGGLNLYNPNQDRFVRLTGTQLAAADRALLQAMTQADISTLATDQQGRVWVGTRYHGLFLLRANAAGQLESLKRVQLATGPARQCEIMDLVIDRAGNVWIATFNEGLFLADAGQVAPLARRAASYNQAQLLALSLDRRGDLWIGTSSRIMWVSARQLQNRQVADAHILPPTFRSIDYLYRDSFDRLWVGTDFGLSVLPIRTADGQKPIVTGKLTTYLPLDSDPNSINSGRVHCILEDRFQVLWLAASAGGLNKIDLRQKPFGHLRRQTSQQPTLPNNYINAVYHEDARNLLWIATRNGFSSYDLSQKTYTNYFSRQLPGNVTGIDVSCIFQASDSTRWFGTRYDGLISLRRRNGRDVLTTYPYTSGPFKHLESIREDRYGTLWMASFIGGLIRMDRNGRVLASYTPRNSTLPTDRFTFLLYDHATSVLWASTRDAGVLKLRVLPTGFELLHQFKHDARDPNSLSVNYAWPLHKDRQGILWVGTIGGGLHQLLPTRSGTEQVRRCNNWLPNSDVESILEDNQGHLWLGSEGLIRINPHTRQVLRYDVADGVQSNSFKIGAACKASDETLYFGGINGITYLKPRYIRANPYPPIVRITSLALANKPVTVGETINGRVLIQKPLDKPQSIQINASENDFSISFVGLNFANPKKHHYAYRLVGYNDTWIRPAPGQRTASYANLPPGSYTFLVKADNGEGRWADQPASLQLNILPPWWKTWWAYLLYATLIGGGLLLARRVVLQQQALKNKVAFEHFQYEKEKELSELKLRFFTNVSHELRTPLTLILGPMEELAASAWKLNGMKDKVLLMHQQTRRLLSLINQLLDFRKMESQQIPLQAAREDVVPFLTELFLMFRLKADEQDIRYSFQRPDTPIYLYFDRSKLEVAVINVLSNALKYTPAGRRVELAVGVAGHPDEPARFSNGQLQTNYLTITVRDEGVGMKPDELHRVFDVYYQASHTDTMRVMGTGIGLSLVRQFIERHGGDVAITSQPNQGTTFTIRLPFGADHLPDTDLATEPVAPAENAPAEPAQASGRVVSESVAPAGTLRLLVVEDNNEVRRYLAHLFDSDFEVSTAVDGLDGWEQAMHILPDVIISDIMMPRSDGLELCKKIKQHPRTMHIPVLLLTARVAAVHELEGLETGADEYVGKPFNPDLLLARVNTLIQNRLKLRHYYQQQLLLEPTELLIPDADKAFLETAMNLVETHLADADFSVQWLVQEMAMSRSVFYRRIKSITGQSAVEFINAVRMKRAAQLLTSGQLRVSEVCALVGLEDIKYFRKAFQQLHGLSPSDYIRKHRLDKAVQEEISG